MNQVSNWPEKDYWDGMLGIVRGDPVVYELFQYLRQQQGFTVNQWGLTQERVERVNALLAEMKHYPWRIAIRGVAIQLYHVDHVFDTSTTC